MTRISATEIVARIGDGEWTASQVLEAYMARTVLSQTKTNCITEGQYFSHKANMLLVCAVPMHTSLPI
jgi:hypothetical protein